MHDCITNKEFLMGLLKYKITEGLRPWFLEKADGNPEAAGLQKTATKPEERSPGILESRTAWKAWIQHGVCAAGHRLNLGRL